MLTFKPNIMFELKLDMYQANALLSSIKKDLGTFPEDDDERDLSDKDALIFIAIKLEEYFDEN